MNIETYKLTLEDRFLLIFPHDTTKTTKEFYTDIFKKFLLGEIPVLSFPDNIKIIVFK